MHRVKFYAAELVIALEHLHSNGILYRPPIHSPVLLLTMVSPGVAAWGVPKGIYPHPCPGAV